VVEGELSFDPIARSAYSIDASLFEIEPLGVIAPRTEADVIAVLKFASERGIPVHPRGGGTGLSGGCLGPGLVLDLSRHLRQVVSIAHDHVVVQAGVVVGALEGLLRPLGYRIGPDPGGPESATIGGVLAENGGGTRSLRAGSMGDVVESVRVVLASGETAEFRPEPWPSSDADPATGKDRLARRIATLLSWHEESIKRSWPGVRRNTAGYALRRAIREDGLLDLSALVVGSEGTLAVITEATLRIEPIPPAQRVMLIPFGRLLDAAAAVSDCLLENPTACELHDWRSLRLARDAVPHLRESIPESAEAALVVQFEGSDPGVVERQSRSLVKRLARCRSLVAEPLTTSQREEAESWIYLRRQVSPHLARLAGSEAAIPLIEDVTVPPAALGEYLGTLQGIFKAHGLNWTVYAHAGEGQIHARPFLELPRDRELLEPLARDVYEAAIRLGGSIAGEHGCGLARTQFLKAQYGDLTAVFGEVKQAFDPLGILNPGKIVSDDPHLLLRHLRATYQPDAVPRPEAELRWIQRSRESHVSACNTCGACRTLDQSLRMCPTFRATRMEQASPRAQVHVMRQLATGKLDPQQWASDELRANADLCIHCQLCATECVAGVDVSSLMLEAKAAHAEQHGLTAESWMLSRVDLWAAFASRWPWIYHRLIDHPIPRWLLERAFGLSRSRDLPRVEGERFFKRAERTGLSRPRPERPGPRVAYFVDIAAAHFMPSVAEAVVGLLQVAGVNVFVPTHQRGCGMPSLVVGELDRARDLLLSNLKILANAVREGYTIICSEPTATLMLRQLALKLTDDLDAQLVAERTMDAGEYLLGISHRGMLPTPAHPLPMKVGYHQPCHLRALAIGTPGLDLIRSIPQLDVEWIDRGCSGMAGTFGLTARNFRLSLRAGRSLRARLRQRDLEIGVTECSACKIQMEQGLRKRTYHPFQLLAVAHGLNPGLRTEIHRFRRKRSASRAVRPSALTD
jgi:FAD/FMN-containing dehydrogenase/Fe-S oxidoreductase